MYIRLISRISKIPQIVDSESGPLSWTIRMTPPESLENPFALILTIPNKKVLITCDHNFFRFNEKTSCLQTLDYGMAVTKGILITELSRVWMALL